MALWSLVTGVIGSLGKALSDIMHDLEASKKLEDFEKAIEKDKVAFKAMKSELRLLITQVDNASKAVALLTNARTFFGRKHPINHVLSSLLEFGLKQDRKELSQLGLALKVDELLMNYTEKIPANRRIAVGVNGVAIVSSAVEMGLDLQALVNNEGSETAKVLREKAKELEEELEFWQGQ